LLNIIEKTIEILKILRIEEVKIKNPEFRDILKTYIFPERKKRTRSPDLKDLPSVFGDVALKDVLKLCFKVRVRREKQESRREEGLKDGPRCEESRRQERGGGKEWMRKEERVRGGGESRRVGLGAWSSRIEDRGSRIEDRGSRIEDRGSRIEDRGSRIEDRGLRIEDRGSRIGEEAGGRNIPL
jgi:hypothetical protein